MLKSAYLVLMVSLLTGCASFVSSATSKMADNITLAILNQDDPATVRDGAPSYLLMIDGMIEGDPDNTNLLLAGAKLYGSYSSTFVDDEARAQRLASKSLSYARRALCLEASEVCEATASKLDKFEDSLVGTGKGELAALYSFAVAWAGWIQINSSD